MPTTLMNILIREATEADFETVARLFNEELHFHASLMPDRYRVAEGVVTQRGFREVLLNPRRALFIAEFEDEAIGLLLMKYLHSDSSPITLPRSYAYVEELIVSEAYRGAGVGRRLMAQAHKWALAQGATEIELNVWEENARALAFYQKLGYETARRTLRIVLSEQGTP